MTILDELGLVGPVSKLSPEDKRRYKKAAYHRWYQNNKAWKNEYLRSYKPIWRKSSVERYEKEKAAQRAYARKNMARQVARNNERYHSDINYNLRRKLSRRIGMAFKHGKGNHRTMEIVGCSLKQFRDYIFSKMSPDMKWSDVMSSRVHIDHIIPCSSFDLTDPEQVKKCFHYTNMQPLWAEDNLRKADKILKTA